jgi:hypothetical protein
LNQGRTEFWAVKKDNELVDPETLGSLKENRAWRTMEETGISIQSCSAAFYVKEQ